MDPFDNPRAYQSSDWRDPRWSSARAVAPGLDSGTRDQRRVLMGGNMIDIAAKSVGGLLMDEVSCQVYFTVLELTNTGSAPLLRLPNRLYRTLVSGRLLLLRLCHCRHQYFQYPQHSYRDQADY